MRPQVIHVNIGRNDRRRKPQEEENEEESSDERSESKNVRFKNRSQTPKQDASTNTVLSSFGLTPAFTKDDRKKKKKKVGYNPDRYKRVLRVDNKILALKHRRKLESKNASNERLARFEPGVLPGTIPPPRQHAQPPPNASNTDRYTDMEGKQFRNARKERNLPPISKSRKPAESRAVDYVMQIIPPTELGRENTIIIEPVEKEPSLQRELSRLDFTRLVYSENMVQRQLSNLGPRDHYIEAARRRRKEKEKRNRAKLSSDPLTSDVKLDKNTVAESGTQTLAVPPKPKPEEVYITEDADGRRGGSREQKEQNRDLYNQYSRTNLRQSVPAHRLRKRNLGDKPRKEEEVVTQVSKLYPDPGNRSESSVATQQMPTPRERKIKQQTAKREDGDGQENKDSNKDTKKMVDRGTDSPEGKEWYDKVSGGLTVEELEYKGLMREQSLVASDLRDFKKKMKKQRQKLKQELRFAKELARIEKNMMNEEMTRYRHKCKIQEMLWKESGQREKERLEGDLAQVESQLQQRRKELAEKLDEELLKEEEELLKKRQDLLDMEHMLVEREEELGQRQTELHAYEKEIEEIEGYLTRRHQISTRKHEELQELNEEMRQLRDDLKTRKGQPHLSQEGRPSSSELVSRATARLNHEFLQQALLESKKSYEASLKENKVTIAKAETTIAQKDYQIKDLRSKLMNMEEELNRKQRYISRMEEQAANYYDERDDYIWSDVDEEDYNDLRKSGKSPSTYRKSATPSKLIVEASTTPTKLVVEATPTKGMSRATTPSRSPRKMMRSPTPYDRANSKTPTKSALSSPRGFLGNPTIINNTAYQSISTINASTPRSLVLPSAILRQMVPAEQAPSMNIAIPSDAAVQRKGDKSVVFLSDEPQPVAAEKKLLEPVLRYKSKGENKPFAVNTPKPERKYHGPASRTNPSYVPVTFAGETQKRPGFVYHTSAKSSRSPRKEAAEMAPSSRSAPVTRD